MASTDNSVKVVDSADLEDDGPLVKVSSIEKRSLFSYLTGSRKEKNEGVETEDSKHSEKKEPDQPHLHEVFHEGDGIRSTYDVEEDDPPSLLEQVKRKFHWSGK